jgi:hypothetical protein
MTETVYRIDQTPTLTNTLIAGYNGTQDFWVRGNLHWSIPGVPATASEFQVYTTIDIDNIIASWNTNIQALTDKIDRLTKRVDELEAKLPK